MVWSGPTGNGLDPVYRAALTRPHTAYSRIDVIDPLIGPSAPLLSDVPVVGGTVSVTLGNRVCRTLTLTLDRSWFPLTAAGQLDLTAALAPNGNRVAVYRGIRYGDESLCYFPTFYGGIDTVQLTRAGLFTLAASDLAADVVAAAFETPQSSVPTNTGLQEMLRLINQPGVVPGGAVFGTSDAAHSLIPALTWQSDRGQALDDLAAADSMIWYPLANGAFVRRGVPWTKPGLAPVLTLTDGGPDRYATNDGGLVTDWTITATRVGVSNAVVYTSERLDGTAPASAIARDTNADSTTYYYGKFGRRPRLIQNQAAQTQQQCLAAAKVALKSAASQQLQFDPVQVVPDGSLELGDLVAAQLENVTGLVSVAGFDLPVREDSAMTLHLRAYTPTS